MTDRTTLTLTLSLEEAQDLLRLLDDHGYFGWVALDGEFTLVADRPPSPRLLALKERLALVLRPKAQVA